MAFTQLVAPLPWVEDYPGACLRMTQNVFQGVNPYYFRSAFIAWQNTQFKHFDRDFPEDVAVILWFDHWGTYNDGLGQYGSDPWNPYFGNWGHVVTRFPGGGLLSSPAYPPNSSNGMGQDWYTSIEQIESIYGGRYLGWTEDVGGARIAAPAPEPPKRDKRKPLAYLTGDTNKKKVRQVLNPGSKSLLHTSDTGATAIAFGPADIELTVSVNLRGPVGAVVTLSAYRYVWDGKGFKEYVYLDSNDVTIGPDGSVFGQLGIANRVSSENQRIGVEATVKSGKGKIEVARFSWKGHTWEV